MPSYDGADTGPSSRFLSASTSSAPRRSPSRQSLSLSRNRSATSLRAAASLAQSIAQIDDDGPSARHSLAHELAVALLPEPSAGSKMLAEEFGIEYDEGAEGIDAGAPTSTSASASASTSASASPSTPDPAAGVPQPDTPPSFANDAAFELAVAHTPASLAAHPPAADTDPAFASPARAPRHRRRPSHDAMAILSQDLESTEKFLSHLRRLDADPAPPGVHNLGFISTSGAGAGSQQPALERLASDVIRKIEETARDREGQVRELLECEREFRKIAGEVGGGDALAALDALEGLEDLMDRPPTASAPVPAESTRALDTLAEEAINASGDWEVDPDQHMREDADDDDDDGDGDSDDSGGSSDADADAYGSGSGTASPSASPLLKDAFSPLPPPPPLSGPPTPAKTIPQLAHLRTATASLVASLAVISEHAQVNGAATTEAGRKIRALKNKLGGWRTEWDSAERSRVRIERWEAGLADAGEPGSVPGTPVKAVRRVDGRKLVEEHLRAFERALSEANVKTQAIMAPA